MSQFGLLLESKFGCGGGGHDRQEKLEQRLNNEVAKENKLDK